jgi:hypothetical protein
MSDIVFRSDAKGRRKQGCDGKRISIEALQDKLRGNACRNMLVIHAVGGCDTTSAIYWDQLLTTNVSASDYLDSMQKSDA